MILLDLLFALRLLPLLVGGLVATKHKDYIAIIICFLYICVTSVNYLYANLALNAVFSTPLVFLTAWYIIKRNRSKA